MLHQKIGTVGTLHLHLRYSTVVLVVELYSDIC